MSVSLVRYDRRDSEVTPPLIVHKDTENMDIYARFNDQKWTYIRTNYLQKYLNELVDLGLRDFIRDYAAETGGEDGISVTLNRSDLAGTDYVIMVFLDSDFGDLGDIYVSRSANVVTIYNSGETGLPFHFVALERINQSI